jgi:hypothetical protein
MASTPRRCARAILDALPSAMLVLRGHLRAARGPGALSVPQFGTLRYVRDHDGASLSDVAASFGLSLPPMSRHIDGRAARRRRGGPTRAAASGVATGVCS